MFNPATPQTIHTIFAAFMVAWFTTAAVYAVAAAATSTSDS
jgi:hypothetical protein